MIRSLITIVAACSLLASTTVSQAKAKEHRHDVALHHPLSSALPSETLIFSEDFNEFDLSRWKHEISMSGGGNWEFEYYTNNRSNSYVRDSVLYLKPTLTGDNIGEANVQNGFTLDLWGSSPADMCTANSFYGCSRTSGGGNLINPIQSAAIRTVGTFDFKFGRMEVRAKLPAGDWLWPAIWLMPTYNSYGQWPASGEIDFVESKGNKGSTSGGVNNIGTTLHYGHNYQSDQWPTTHGEKKLTNGTFNDDFHVFGLVWTNQTLYTYLDSDTAANRILEVSMTEQSFWQRGGFDKTSFDNIWQGRSNAAPFDQSFYIVMNVAVGGVSGYFPDGVDGKPWSDKSATAAADFYRAKSQWLPTWKGENSALQVDWIKVYQ